MRKKREKKINVRLHPNYFCQMEDKQFHLKLIWMYQCYTFVFKMSKIIFLDFKSSVIFGDVIAFTFLFRNSPARDSGSVF